MQCTFDPPNGFTPTVQDSLRAMASKAFDACKLQFSSRDDHAQPHCRFHLGGFVGNTGDISGIHLTFSDEKHLSDLTAAASTLEQLIHHELVHFFQIHLCGREPFEYLPKWFYEGMAVAFSGQGLIARNSHMDTDYRRFGGKSGWERFYLMNQHRDLDFSRPPFDALYDSWGALFIFAVSEQPNIFPNHAVAGSDGFLQAAVGDAERAKAIAILETAASSGFEAALKKHTHRAQMLESDFREFLAPD